MKNKQFKKNRKTIAILVPLFLLIFVGAIYFGTGQENPTGKVITSKPVDANHETVKIGFVAPLSGDAASWGINIKNGFDLAIDELRKQGKNIEVVYGDDACSPKTGINVVNKMINVDEVDAIFGFACSSVVLSIAPMLEESKTLLISAGASSPKVTDAGDYIFRTWPSDAFEAEVMADFAYNKLNQRKISVIYINNEYGRPWKDVFQKNFESFGGVVPAAEAFDQGGKDFKTQLLKIKNTDSESLVIISNPLEIPLILKQSKELGLDIQFLSNVGFEDPDILESVGNIAEGTIYSKPVSEITPDFISAYEQKYLEKPGVCADNSYDAVKLYFNAREKTVSKNSEAIKDQLYKVSGYAGASGMISFDKFGDVQKPATIRTVRNREFVDYE